LISLCVKLRIRWIAWAFLLVILSQILLRAAIIVYGFRVLHLVDQRDIIGYLARIYYPTYCRLDGLTIGVALAAMRCYRPALWSRLMAQGNRLLFAGGIGLCAAALLMSSKLYILSGATIFTLLGVSFGLMTASALSPACILSRVRSRVVTLLAELAYSIYLTHLIAFYAAGVVLSGFQLGKHDVVTFIVTMLAVLGASLTLFTMVERPFLRLRDHRFAYQNLTVSDLSRPADQYNLPASLGNRQT
jgi:peptidoglycan/LPS O-acetylase OafA/YrhL